VAPCRARRAGAAGVRPGQAVSTPIDAHLHGYVTQVKPQVSPSHVAQVSTQLPPQLAPQLAQVPQPLASQLASQLTAVGPQNGLQPFTSRVWTWFAIAWPWTVPRADVSAGVVSNESTRSSSTDSLTLRMSRLPDGRCG
jgi:hypothetical protein